MISLGERLSKPYYILPGDDLRRNDIAVIRTTTDVFPEVIDSVIGELRRLFPEIVLDPNNATGKPVRIMFGTTPSIPMQVTSGQSSRNIAEVRIDANAEHPGRVDVTVDIPESSDWRGVLWFLYFYLEREISGLRSGRYTLRYDHFDLVAYRHAQAIEKQLRANLGDRNGSLDNEVSDKKNIGFLKKMISQFANEYKQNVVAQAPPPTIAGFPLDYSRWQVLSEGLEPEQGSHFCFWRKRQLPEKMVSLYDALGVFGDDLKGTSYIIAVFREYLDDALAVSQRRQIFESCWREIRSEFYDLPLGLLDDVLPIALGEYLSGIQKRLQDIDGALEKLVFGTIGLRSNNPETFYNAVVFACGKALNTLIDTRLQLDFTSALKLRLDGDFLAEKTGARTRIMQGLAEIQSFIPQPFPEPPNEYKHDYEAHWDRDPIADLDVNPAFRISISQESWNVSLLLQALASIQGEEFYSVSARPRIWLLTPDSLYPDIATEQFWIGNQQPERIAVTGLHPFLAGVLTLVPQAIDSEK